MSRGGGRVVLVAATVVDVVADVEVVPAVVPGKEPEKLDVGAAGVGSLLVEQPASSSAAATRWVRPPARMTQQYAIPACTFRGVSAT